MMISTFKFVGSALAGLWLSLGMPAQVDNQSRSFNVNDGGTLEVRVGSADIRIRPGAAGTVQIDGVELGRRASRELKITQSGDTIRVEFQGRGHFEILVPTRFNLDLHTRSGDISVLGPVDGHVEAHSASGDFLLDDVSGDLTIHTGGGDITGGQVGGNGSIHSGGGDIMLDSITGSMEVRTGGGDVGLGKVGGDLALGTGAGDVEVGDVAGEVRLTTGGGDVGIGSASNGVKAVTAGGDIDLLGARGRVDITTAGGDLTLRDLRGSLKAVTAGGDVTVELSLEDTSQENSITSAGGDVVLYLDPNIGVTVECEIKITDWNQRERHEIRSTFGGVRMDVDPASGKIRGSIDIAGGGPVITIHTIDGDIDVKER